ncbi:hypothetical protein EYZ11_011760 [Aspergillus tanneri]|uniref:HMG box domain-containing protein n=1 Tax=Aspergillus tanneri TaxID=1220188 RepID=A0A4S3J1Z3_9EURO|nr:uncharacterized protein ATNIH1004_004635 [Aspergillus tanneri]KAA8648750.1 hypothetical protein ATNIH1004_004635 [Aspergillus tanneri]THC88793.1 hypothetical protein EYZ11_011760 [Aspergillus tanneri]
MSYDRVLPKPAALHYDTTQVTFPRLTSNLLEHKIMKDDVSKIAMVDHQVDGIPSGNSCRYTTHGLPQIHLSSINRAKIAFNKMAATAPIEPPKSKTTIPLRERSSASERSSSSSPVKSTASREPVTQFCLCQPDPKIPRPRNAFILYRQHYQAAVVAQNPGLANPDISKIIGEQWRKLPQETKDEWKALAEEEKARHQQQYPEYRYQPRRYGRDGNVRNASSGISHNPPGSTVCNRCGGRVMNPPVSPETSFTRNGSSGSNSITPQSETIAVRGYQCREKEPGCVPNPIKIGVNGESRQRHWDENGSRSPDSKRRRFNTQAVFKPNLREKSPDTPYPMSPYSTRSDISNPRDMLHMLQPPRSQRHVKEYPTPDPSLKLPPLQTSAPVARDMTAMTPFSKEASASIEATVMTIPFLNKIKVLAKISPPLVPSFRDGPSQRRGPVIAVDGQDPAAVKTTIDYLSHVLQKEGKYHTRVFEGPEIRPREDYSESGQMGDATVDYLNTISVWHRISDEIVSFVKASSESSETRLGEGNCGSPGVSPKTIIPKTAEMQISSPAPPSESGSVSVSSSSGTTSYSVPVALIPRYQLTTADSFACSVPINDSYAPLDHWQWMASLWRACVGPDITVYIREYEKDELERLGGNPVEVRLQDARTIVVRRGTGSHKELEEKAMKRVGFEVEDFLTQ